MLPELARRLIAEYCPPEGLVADPMCGIGTTLVEAAALGRRAVGVELEPRWAELARANLTHALPPEQAALAEVRQGDARRLPELLADLSGRVDLVVTSPPYACDAGVIDKPAWRAGQPLCPRDTLNYSRDPANLGRARGQTWRPGIAEVLAGCAQLLRPGGLLVTVTKNTRRAGPTERPGHHHRPVGRTGRVRLLQHLIALHAAVRDGGLVARPSFWQLTQTRKARARGEPAHLVVHEDVLVFTKTQSSWVPMAEPTGLDRSGGSLPAAAAAAVGVADRPAARRRPTGRPLPARLHRTSGQDAARHRPPRHHRLQPARRPGPGPDVRHRHHPGRGRPPRPPRHRRRTGAALGRAGPRQHHPRPQPRRHAGPPRSSPATPATSPACSTRGWPGRWRWC